MNAFTIAGGRATAGIALRKGDIARVIEVGEEGRGRKRVLVPVPSGAVVEGREDGRPGIMMTAPDRPGEVNAVVVLVRDHSGFRGSWDVRNPRTQADWQNIVKRQAAPAEEREGMPAPEPTQDPTWRVIAEGFSAQGDAGRMGGGPEFLTVLLDGQAIEIVRHGRLYGEPSCLKVENRGGTLVITNPRKEAESVLAASAW